MARSLGGDSVTEDTDDPCECSLIGVKTWYGEPDEFEEDGLPP
jgi:hypothetical protein